MASESALAVPEILTRILHLTIYQPTGLEYADGLESENITISKEDPPWPFLLVSKYWRELVLSTPFLWSTIVIVLTEHRCSFEEVARLLPMVDAHLQRSKTAPLTLLITLLEGTATRSRQVEDERDPVVPMFALFGKVLDKQQHWQDVDLYIEAIELASPHITYPILPTTFTVRLGSMPRLKQLKLNLKAQEWCRQLIELGPCPHLDTIELTSNWDVVPRRLSDSHETDFPMLRTIYLRTQDPRASATCWNLLESSSRVEDLELLLNWRSSPKMASRTLECVGRSISVCADPNTPTRLLHRNTNVRTRSPSFINTTGRSPFHIRRQHVVMPYRLCEKSTHHAPDIRAGSIGRITERIPIP